jgi:membrane-associated phospholipid phosphatase
MTSIDIFLQNYFSLIRTPFLTEFFYIISVFFDLTSYFVVLSVLVAYLVYLVRGIRYSFLFLFTLFSGSILVYILKLIFNVNRPPDPIMFAFGKSFPSYHATMATMFFSMLMYIFDDYLSGFYRVLFNIFCVLSIAVVAFSRIYLGVHWFSDVAFGILIGVIISHFTVFLWRRKFK